MPSRNSFLLFATSLIFIFLTILIHHLSKSFYLYWQTGWIDSTAHLLGGIGATLFFLWIYRSSSLAVSFFYIFIVGLFWEIYEFQFGLVFYSSNYFTDTCSDLIMDLLGGALAYLMVKYIFNSWLKNSN